VALASHPGIREAAVLKMGDEQLVACVAAAGDVSDTDGSLISALRRFLAARLPSFMVPAAFLVLPELPLTANGKVDRRALARLAESGGTLARPAEAAWVAPRNPVEELLAELWAEVLGIPQIGAHDDFFALGGHSLLGVRLLSRVRDTFGVELPVRALFTHPTLAGLAEALAAEMMAQAGDELLGAVLTAGAGPGETR